MSANNALTSKLNPLDVCLAFGRVKDAALYFPCVVPLPVVQLGNEVMVGIRRIDETVTELEGFVLLQKLLSAFTGSPEINAILADGVSAGVGIEAGREMSHWRRRLGADYSLNDLLSLLPPHLSTNSDFRKRWCSAILPLTTFVLEILAERKGLDLRKGELASASAERDGILSRFVRDYELYKNPFLIPVGFYASSRGNSAEHFAAQLSEIQAVDTEAASWEQINEFRKDSQSHMKLMRLRRFFTDNYAGKDKSYIQDDLALRLHEHEQAASKWGLKTIPSILELILNGDTIKTIAAGSIITSYLGGMQTISPLIGGAALEVGRVALTLAKRKIEYADYLSRHPLAYIIDAKNALTPLNDA